MSPAESLSSANAKARERAHAAAVTGKHAPELTEIRAPFCGIMGRFQVRKGSLLDEGEALTTAGGQQPGLGLLQRHGGRVPRVPDGARRWNPRPMRLSDGHLVSHFSQPGAAQTIEADFNSETGNIAFRAGASKS